MNRTIWRDSDWREPGWRPVYWNTIMGTLENDSNARLIDRPPATTMRDVLAMTAGPVWRFTIRHARAFVAAVRAYRENMK